MPPTPPPPEKSPLSTRGVTGEKRRRIPAAPAEKARAWAREKKGFFGVKDSGFCEEEEEEEERSHLMVLAGVEEPAFKMGVEEANLRRGRRDGVRGGEKS